MALVSRALEDDFADEEDFAELDELFLLDEDFALLLLDFAEGIFFTQRTENNSSGLELIISISSRSLIKLTMNVSLYKIPSGT